MPHSTHASNHGYQMRKRIRHAGVMVDACHGWKLDVSGADPQGYAHGPRKVRRTFLPASS
jgi:hypothetical protein